MYAGRRIVNNTVATCAAIEVPIFGCAFSEWRDALTVNRRTFLLVFSILVMVYLGRGIAYGVPGSTHISH